MCSLLFVCLPLQVDYIDLMLIHSMDCDEGPGAHLVCQKGEPKGTWEDSWKALESLVDKGKRDSVTKCLPHL